MQQTFKTRRQKEMKTEPLSKAILRCNTHGDFAEATIKEAQAHIDEHRKNCADNIVIVYLGKVFNLTNPKFIKTIQKLLLVSNSLKKFIYSLIFALFL